MARDLALEAHKAWLGFVQPVGMVVSPAALLAAQVILDENAAPLQRALRAFLERSFKTDRHGDLPDSVHIPDFPAFTREILGWEPGDLAGAPGGPPLPEELTVALPEFEDHLAPTYAVPDPERPGGWLLLVQTLFPGTPLDQPHPGLHERAWKTSPQLRLERLLRERQIPAGLLCNGTHLRLVYAPRGEASGHLTFPLLPMLETAGRPILAALRMLLDPARLFQGDLRSRLPALLEASRKFQNEVSEQLSEQALLALYELLRGFHAADEASQGKLLRGVLPEDIYGGLLTVLLRLVFLLYAEEREVAAQGPLYGSSYALTTLHERLRADRGLQPDTMDQRFGAWSWLLTLFRLVHHGIDCSSVGASSRAEVFLKMPPRYGDLFDPERYTFLEGRVREATQQDEGFYRRLSSVPRLSDGVVLRVLDNLMFLDGERISYRTLDVEHLGSVYENMMGFTVERAGGAAIAVTPQHVVIDLDQLLAAKPAERAKWLKDRARCELAGKPAEALKKARTVPELLTALDRRLSPRTPHLLHPGSLFLQPTEERRRSGSHYTPPELTRPIVRRTLEPVLGPPEQVAPDAILALKICDPAMGSGAFLVEVCRQLGDALVAAWTRFPDQRPPIPVDEQEVTVARRLVAQRCLHGVDKNPFAVALAKLSLWLVTLSRELPFTFLDHALQHGDSLVGLSPEQIACVQWVLDEKPSLLRPEVDGAVQQALRLRLEIQALAQGGRYHEQRDLLDRTELATARVRTIGDATVACFFGATTDKARGKDAEQLRDALFTSLDASFGRAAAMAQDLREGTLPVDGKGATIHKLPPFHWELVFPEVFHRPNPGFDAIVGNPPFRGGSKISGDAGAPYLAWLLTATPEAHGNADLVAHFFRRSFALLRSGGAFGLVATNTIAQGDTRSTGLRWICNHGGVIYDATRRVKWPGRAAVIVSVVHVGKTSPPNPLPIDGQGEERGEGKGKGKGKEKPRKARKHPDTLSLLPTDPSSPASAPAPAPASAPAPPPPHRWGGGWGVRFLDHRPVPQITAYLFDKGTSEDPSRLAANEGKSFLGVKTYGQGFVFDDADKNANAVEEMHRLIDKNPKNRDCIFPYLGGEDLNSSPTQSHHRYVINFGQMSEDEARQWPDLMDIVERKVKPERLENNREGYRKYWWQFGEKRVGLWEAIRPLKRVLAIARVSKSLAFSFVETGTVFSEQLIVVAQDKSATFSVIQSGTHEIWSRFFSSSMKDDLRYTPSDCFETFPFPWVGWPTEEEVAEGGRWHGLEQVGEAYHRFRAERMVSSGEGLTETYNRFHDPEETSPEIQQLRELHARMDRAVLDAYGWTDIPTDCAFLLDHQDDEEDEEDDSKKRRKKKPWRHRWPDEVRDEVLARLLELNLRRSEAETLGLPGGGRSPG